MGDRIREKRKEKKLTQEKLAELVDVSPSHVGEIERGSSVCSLSVLVDLSTVLELNLETLVKGIDTEPVDSAFSEILDELPEENKDLYLKICESIANRLQ